MRVGDILQAGVSILGTKVSSATKRVLAATGSFRLDQAEDENSEWWQHVGFASIPPNVEKGKAAAQALRIVQGAHDYIIASMDARGLDLYGNLKAGETCIYAAGADGKSQGRSLWKGDGSVTHYSRAGNTESGGGIMMQIDAMNDTIRILNSKGMGIIITPDDVSILAKSSGATFEASGDLSIVAKAQAQFDGGSILLGSAGVPGLNSALMGPTGLVGAANPKIILGV